MDKEQFIEFTLEYLKSHRNYNNWSKEEAVVNALHIVVHDIGVTQNLLYAIGLDEIDLYTRE